MLSELPQIQGFRPEWYQGRDVALHQDHMGPVGVVMSKQAVPGRPHALASTVAGKKQCSQDGTVSVFGTDKKKIEGRIFATRSQKYAQEGEGNCEKEKLEVNQHC